MSPDLVDHGLLPGSGVGTGPIINGESRINPVINDRACRE